jgi:5-bromo-4-chloroindolyl phosphate hydrolysis protein
MTAPLARMIEAGDKIFRALEKNPRDSQQIRKFMNYYLPTSVKLLNHYKTLSSAGAGENVQKSLQSIADSLNMIADAFEKQLDRLYADDQLDINAEISALETMMAADGLTETLSIQRTASK